jgi:hypothetical protein
MEPNNIENQIREKLHSREIQPSAQAWDRLDAMLTVAEEKKTKRSFGWLYIAASILVFVTLGMFFFAPKTTKIEPQNNVVETKVKKDSLVKEPNSIFETSNNSQENVVVSSNQKQSTTSHKSSTNSQEVSISNQKSTIANQEPINQNQIIKDKPIEFQNSSDVALKDLPKIETRNEIVVQRYDNTKSDEALLASLDKVAKQSTNQKSVVKIDAKNLLYQVDGELELSFREKVIKKVSKNYKEVKVALANRNNE